MGIRTKNGRKLCMDASIRLLKTEDEVDGAVIVLRDDTEDIASDRKLHKEREELRAIVSSIDDIVLVLDKDFQLLKFYQSSLQDILQDMSPNQ